MYEFKDEKGMDLIESESEISLTDCSEDSLVLIVEEKKPVESIIDNEENDTGRKISPSNENKNY